MAKKLTITQARRLYADGATIGILANKLAFNNMYFKPYDAQIDHDGDDFDAVVSDYAYYHSESEIQRGRTPAFYLLKKPKYTPLARQGVSYQNPGTTNIALRKLGNGKLEFLGFVDGKGRIRKAKARKVNPEGSARELELFIENDSNLYRQQHTPINKNLINKIARGIYDHSKAVKLFGYLAESGAKKYAREYGGGSTWHTMFPTSVRREVAESLTNTFEGEAKSGNYDNLLAKKYQR